MKEKASSSVGCREGTHVLLRGKLLSPGWWGRLDPATHLFACNIGGCGRCSQKPLKTLHHQGFARRLTCPQGTKIQVWGMAGTAPSPRWDLPPPPVCPSGEGNLAGRHWETSEGAN